MLKYRELGSNWLHVKCFILIEDDLFLILHFYDLILSFSLNSQNSSFTNPSLGNLDIM